MITMRPDVAMLQAPTTKHAQSQKGSVLVEFALILPIFLALIFGIVTFSLALYNKTVLTMATREGARAGAMYVATAAANIAQADIAAKTAAEARTVALCQNLISFGSINPIVTSSVVNKNITVHASINYTGLFWDFILYTNSETNYPISAQTTMRTEYQ